jgi:hypothetical protein
MCIEISYPYFTKVQRVAKDAAMYSAWSVSSDLKVLWQNNSSGGSNLFVLTERNLGKQGVKPVPKTAEELERAITEYNEQYPDAYMVGVEIVLNSAISDAVKARYEKTTGYVENEECEFCTGAADRLLWKRSSTTPP